LSPSKPGVDAASTSAQDVDAAARLLGRYEVKPGEGGRLMARA
jgi:hypothetical protein